MIQARVVAAACAVSMGALTLHAQPEFNLVGTPTAGGDFRATDINEDGRVVVGLDGAGGVWRWARGSGITMMPPITVAGGTGPCTVNSAYVSSDGTIVAGDAGGPQCAGRVRQVYRWVFSFNPTIGPANSGPVYYRVHACTATGTPVGTVEDFGYLSMYHQSWGVFPSDGYDDNEPGCVPGDWIYSDGVSCTPDGRVLGTIIDCLASHPGGVWSGGNNPTRSTQVPVAGSWDASVLISQTSKWTPGTGWTPLFIPGSVLRDVSWDGRVVVGDVSVGPTMQAGYHTEGIARDLRTTLINAGVPVPASLLTVQAVSGDGRWVIGRAVLSSGQMQPFVARLPHVCGDIDFNNDQMFPDVLDIEALITTMQGNVCSPPCDSIDFNSDGQYPDTADIDAFLRVFSGGSCF